MTFAWYVNAIHFPNPGNQFNVEGDTVSLQLQAVDTWGGTPTFSAVGLPPGLSIDPNTGLISGTITPGSAANGPYNVAIQTADSDTANCKFFTWYISSSISLTNPGTLFNGEGDTVSLQIQASDSSGGTLTYSAMGLPNGLTIDPNTGRISGTINTGSTDFQVFNAKITASDGSANSQMTFTWYVNNSITIINPGDQYTYEGEAISLKINFGSAIDDRWGLTYSATGLPPGLFEWQSDLLDRTPIWIEGVIAPGSGARLSLHHHVFGQRWHLHQSGYV